MNESKFFRRDIGRNRFGNDASGSDPWAYVSHEVSIDPIDDSGINVSNLEQLRTCLKWEINGELSALDRKNLMELLCQVDKQACIDLDEADNADKD